MIVVSRLCYRGTACVARQWCPHVLWRRSRVCDVILVDCPFVAGALLHDETNSVLSVNRFTEFNLNSNNNNDNITDQQRWGQIRICICKYKYKYKYGIFVFDQISNHVFVFVFVFVFDPLYLVYLTNKFSNTLFSCCGPFSKHKFMEHKLTWIFFINMFKSAILFQNKCRGLILLIPIGGCGCALDLACQWVCDKPLA